MAFEVCLADHVDAVAVAELVHVGVIGIVTCAQGIDIPLLHQPDVSLHAFAAYHIPSSRINLMTVHALDEHGLAVYQQLVSANLYLPESDGHRDVIARITGYMQAVEVGCLCTP